MMKREPKALHLGSVPLTVPPRIATGSPREVEQLHLARAVQAHGAMSAARRPRAKIRTVRSADAPLRSAKAAIGRTRRARVIERETLALIARERLTHQRRQFWLIPIVLFALIATALL